MRAGIPFDDTIQQLDPSTDLLYITHAWCAETKTSKEPRKRLGVKWEGPSSDTGTPTNLACPAAQARQAKAFFDSLDEEHG